MHANLQTDKKKFSEFKLGFLKHLQLFNIVRETPRMKLTKSQLKQLIKEELGSVITEDLLPVEQALELLELSHDLLTGFRDGAGKQCSEAAGSENNLIAGINNLGNALEILHSSHGHLKGQ